MTDVIVLSTVEWPSTGAFSGDQFPAAGSARTGAGFARRPLQWSGWRHCSSRVGPCLCDAHGPRTRRSCCWENKIWQRRNPTSFRRNGPYHEMERRPGIPRAASTVGKRHRANRMRNGCHAGAESTSNDSAAHSDWRYLTVAARNAPSRTPAGNEQKRGEGQDHCARSAARSSGMRRTRQLPRTTCDQRDQRDQRD